MSVCHITTHTHTSCVHTYIHTQYLSARHVLSVVGKQEWRAIGERNFPVWMFVTRKKRSVTRPENIEASPSRINYPPKAIRPN